MISSGRTEATPNGPWRLWRAYRMILKLYTSPFCVPAGGIWEPMRSSSGALYKRPEPKQIFLLQTTKSRFASPGLRKPTVDVVVALKDFLLGPRFERVQAEIGYFQHPTAIDETIRRFQVSVRFHWRIMQINQSLKKTRTINGNQVYVDWGWSIRSHTRTKSPTRDAMNMLSSLTSSFSNISYTKMNHNWCKKPTSI